MNDLTGCPIIHVVTDTTESSPRSPAPSGAETPGPAGRRALSDRLPRAWMFPLLPFAVTWVLTVAAWFASNAIYHTRLPWTTWLWFGDAGFYRDIASVGYGKPLRIVPAAGFGSPFTATGRSPFFPLLPVLIRLVSYVTARNFAVADVVGLVLAGAMSAVAVWALTARLSDRRTADRAAILYCLFPGAMVFGMIYPEPFAVGLSALCLLAAVNRRWLTAGVLALLAGASEPLMVALIPALGLTALHAIWTRRDWRSLIAPVLAPLGTLAYFAYYGHAYHDYLFWSRMEAFGWHQHFDWGLAELRDITWTNHGASSHPIFSALVVATFWVAVIGIALLISMRAPLPVIVYTVGVFLLLVLSSGGGTRPRLVLLMSGIFIGLAAKLPKWLFWPLAVCSAATLAFVIAWWPHNLPPSP